MWISPNRLCADLHATASRNAEAGGGFSAQHHGRSEGFVHGSRHAFFFVLCSAGEYTGAEALQAEHSPFGCSLEAALPRFVYFCFQLATAHKSRPLGLTAEEVLLGSSCVGKRNFKLVTKAGSFSGQPARTCLSRT